MGNEERKETEEESSEYYTEDDSEIEGIMIWDDDEQLGAGGEESEV